MLASDPDVEPMPVFPLSDGDPERGLKELISELDCPFTGSVALPTPLRPNTITVANVAIEIVLTIRRPPHEKWISLADREPV